mgnify:CR=1 FL=1
MSNKYLTCGQDTFYKYPELYQIRNKRTGHRVLNCASILECEIRLKNIRRKNWKLAKELVIVKLDRKEELQWKGQ